MKKFALLCAVAALAACSEAEAPEAEAEAPVAEEAAVAHWPIEAGTYEYSRSDGVAGVNTVAADGTFSNAITGGEVETGTWAEEDGMSCLIPAAGDKRCYTFTPPDADGNLTGTMADGTTATIRKTG